ncbi:MAG: MFS transporter, partial [Saprospiraceae bacterium]
AKIMGNQKAMEEEASFWEVVRILLSKKTFIFVAFACGLHTFSNYGVGNFFAPFLARVHGMPVEDIGMWLGITSGFGGIIGTFLGGFLADKYGRKDLRWYMWIPIIAGLLNFPFSYFAFFSGNLNVVLFTYFITALLTALYLGPSIAVTHNLIDAKKRALASAILFLVLNFIGLGLGPVAIGIISDYLSADYGAESLRYAFTITWITGTISLILFYLGSKTYQEEALVKKVTTTKKENKASDMGPILNIVLGVFLLFVVGLFFLQMGLAGVNVLGMSLWILALIGLLFASGVYLTAKGYLNGE